MMCRLSSSPLEFIPRGDDTFSQLTDVLHVVFVNLLHHGPDFVVYRIKVRTVRWPKYWWYEARSPFFNISTVSHDGTQERYLDISITK